MRSADIARNVRDPLATEKRPIQSDPYKSFAVMLLKVALALAVVLSVLPFGSTGAFAGSLAALTFAAIATATVFTSPPAEVVWPIRLTLGATAFVVSFVYLQTLPGVPGIPPNGIWMEAGQLLGTPLAGTVSVEPATSLATIPWLAAPLLAFATTLWLLHTDKSALAMLRFLSYSGGLIAAFGVVQFGFFPESLLLGEKRAYLDSLTTVFVNRNSAATYLGITILALSSLIAMELHGLRLRTFLSMMVSDRRGIWRYRIVFEIALVGICVFALILTKSRAGNASTIIALTVFAALASRDAKASGSRLKKALKSGATALAVLIAVGFIALVFGGRTILRAQSRGLNDDRFCIYPSVWNAARDAWPWGTGAGTFEVVFPQYRDPACGIYGLWDRAHQFYLEGLVTIGAAMPVLCVLSYAVLLTILVKGLRVRRRFRAVPAAGIAVLLLVTAHDMVDFSLQIPGIAFSTAVLLGTCCAVASRDRLGRRRGTSSRRGSKPGEDAPPFPPVGPQDAMSSAG